MVTALITGESIRGVQIVFSWGEKHFNIFIDESLLQEEKNLR